MALSPSQFQHRILKWYDAHGRKELPWQKKISPYRVWISEIMLQQTQVTTVIAYFEKFMKRFPTMESLAQAPLDEVLHYWTGLGYYARARHLHQTAQYLMTHHEGCFPASLSHIEALPGIGRSTAGAIYSLGMKKKAAILDGNVKRVLSRYFAIPGWSGHSAVLKKFWELAETYTPSTRCHHYNQAMMDLGALICTPQTPHCKQCPLKSHCQAFALQQIELFPEKKPKKTIPTRHCHMFILRQGDFVLLQQKPSQGLWGGLWCFPQLEGHSTSEFTAWIEAQWGIDFKNVLLYPPFTHTFSHFHLQIQPWVHLLSSKKIPMETSSILWYNLRNPQKVGLPLPIHQLLQELRGTLTHDITHDSLLETTT